MIKSRTIAISRLSAGDIFIYKGKKYVFGQLHYWRANRVYDRSEKGYVCTEFEDISEEIYLPGDTLVNVPSEFCDYDNF